ncbi:MAG: TetR/AcrR family transcriptional regulator [Pseudomonadota bacterium]
MLGTDASDTKSKTPSTERQKEIIAIATDLFLQSGFFGTSMTHIAKACAIRKASLYHHFESKDELFIACVITGYEDAIALLTATQENPSLSHEQRISDAIDILYDVTVNSTAGRMSPVIAEVSRSMPALSERFYNEYIAVQRETLKRIVLQGVEDGVFKTPDFEVLYHVVFGPIVTLSLSLDMFASMDNLDERFPVERLKDGHKEFLIASLIVR